jgi:LAO/AO transport system kinase
MSLDPVDTASLVRGVLDQQRRALAKAITLIESTREDHQIAAQRMLEQLLPHTGKSVRIGVSGVPGVGKSTFIEAFGTFLTSIGKRVAVLAVDPSSARTGGSILGDKTRMIRLAADPAAFIRPSPSAGSLGGVARRTREVALACEAAGYDVVLVETVGVGQSEVTVASMVDFFLVLMLAGAGDELQGIKKGILELADALAINKADGDNLRAAERAAAEYRGALRLFRPASATWTARVVTVSAVEERGMDGVWEMILEHHSLLSGNGELEAKRESQRLSWFRSMLEDGLLRRFMERADVKAMVADVKPRIRAGQITPTDGARRVLDLIAGCLPPGPELAD